MHVKTKTLAIIAVFTAISVALVISPAKFPAPFAPFLKYQIWEIPIVAAFLLYGSSIGFSITVMNTVVLLAVYPGDLPTGPLYNLAAVSSMLLGVYLAQRFVPSFSRRYELHVILSTAFGCVLRVGCMSAVNWAFLRYPYPVGYSLPADAIIAMLPIIGLFNATLVLYTIPLGYAIYRAVAIRMDIVSISTSPDRLSEPTK
jgi:riboflavin transporter FmnP